MDKPNIRTVFHLQPAPGPEDYLQEAGRAGRDGAPGRAILFVPSTRVPKDERCRRASLLEAFGEDAPACTGCDVCLGRARVPQADAEAAVARLSPWARRFTADEARAFLAGRVTPGLWESDLPRRPGWGLWLDEDDLTVRELWNGLERGGWVTFSPRGPWKGLLRPEPQEHACY